MAPAFIVICKKKALTKFFNVYPRTFRLFGNFTNSTHQQNCSLVFPAGIACGTDKMISANTCCNNVSRKLQQRLIVEKIRFLNHSRNKTQHSTSAAKLREQTSLSI